jgi:hypothetical protein
VIACGTIGLVREEAVREEGVAMDAADGEGKLPAPPDMKKRVGEPISSRSDSIIGVSSFRAIWRPY